MIAAAVEREIRELLAEGTVSQRKIAQRLGVSRGTVNAIACGRRPDYAARRREPPSGWIPPSGLPTRCPGCGGLVQMPCLACHVRAIMRRQRSVDMRAYSVSSSSKTPAISREPCNTRTTSMPDSIGR